MIGGDNYVTRNERHRQVIMHTIVDGDIKVIKTEVNNVWASNHSLPTRYSGSYHLKCKNKSKTIEKMSTVQIAFSDCGEHFINFDLHNDK